MSDFMKTKEVMERLGVCRGTVYNLIKRGLLDSRRISPRNIGIPRASFEAYLVKQRLIPSAVAVTADAPQDSAA